mmetsp:Transcript_17442/g.50827  ORF Transcript_17442/g.50827 Transcript_17442/m.50827 type:complete len:211 (-) Transcript_17442:562-1194(-)
MIRVPDGHGPSIVAISPPRPPSRLTSRGFQYLQSEIVRVQRLVVLTRRMSQFGDVGPDVGQGGIGREGFVAVRGVHTVRFAGGDEHLHGVVVVFEAEVDESRCVQCLSQFRIGLARPGPRLALDVFEEIVETLPLPIFDGPHRLLERARRSAVRLQSPDVVPPRTSPFVRAPQSHISPPQLGMTVPQTLFQDIDGAFHLPQGGIVFVHFH